LWYSESEWRWREHHTYNQQFKDETLTLLLLHQDEDNLMGMLPPEMAHHIIYCLAQHYPRDGMCVTQRALCCIVDSDPSSVIGHWSLVIG
jgi:hypothetical protein